MANTKYDESLRETDKQRQIDRDKKKHAKETERQTENQRKREKMKFKIETRKEMNEAILQKNTFKQIEIIGKRDEIFFLNLLNTYTPLVFLIHNCKKIKNNDI
jgi:hypothetical protein